MPTVCQALFKHGAGRGAHTSEQNERVRLLSAYILAILVRGDGSSMQAHHAVSQRCCVQWGKGKSPAEKGIGSGGGGVSS